MVRREKEDSGVRRFGGREGDEKTETRQESKASRDRWGAIAGWWSEDAATMTKSFR